MDSKYSGESLSWRSILVRPFRTLMGLGTSSTGSTDANSIPSSPSSARVCKYDVFLSFRGTDTRNNFTDHLYAHLIRKGIFTFKDDRLLEKGEPISPQLLQAIKDSRVSIVVFSKHYADSTWCLEEMATIAECKKEFNQTAFSVFYDVDPSDVRKQSGVYENAFVLHSKKFKQVPSKVDGWRRAMTDLANSVGWDIRDQPESREIEKIVQAVIKKLDHKFSVFADDLIGIQPRVERLENLLQLSSEDDDCRVLGILGMGGIGKTTLATVLYDKISYQFEASCFIENASKIYRDGGDIAIQKQILGQALDEKNLETYTSLRISEMVRNRLSHIKVLIVLDDVHEPQHLDKLAVSPKLLGTGSRIIITTRNEQVLKAYGANEIYKVPLMNDNDGHELFCKKAFKNDDPSSSCLHMIPEVLDYAQSLPLAIIVVGSFLYTRDATQWKHALERLRSNPEKKIMDVLQISFEGLQPEEKEIFLHIACFFKGEREDYVKRILDGCGLYPEIGIPVIIEKSLITIRNQEIHMHEMLQKLGMQIVQEQNLKEPGLWSRLWLYEHFHHVMTTETGTNYVKAIVLDQKEDVSKYSELRAEEFSKMKGLRLLILYHNNFLGTLHFLSSSLQYLLWHSYPFASLPLNFQPNGLVELNMPDSKIKRLWVGIKYFPHLKRMDLSNSKCLIETPNFEGIPKLMRLDLTGCTNLSQVHPSIGFLDELSFLSLRNCSSLVSLDLGNDHNLRYLRVLHLSGCTKLENTPDFTGLSRLEYLDLEQCTSLSTVDESIGALAKLKFLSLRHCTNLVTIPNFVHTMTSLATLDLCGCLKLSNMPLGLRSGLKGPVYYPISFGSFESYHLRSLIFLDVGFCNLHEVPYAIEELRGLERLNLEGNNFVSIPHVVRGLSSLAYLNCSHCNQLKYLPELPLTLSSDSPVGRYFRTVSGSRNHRSGLYIFNCPKLKLMKDDNLFDSPIGFDAHSSFGGYMDFQPFRQPQPISIHKIENLAFSWLTRLVEDPRHFRCGFDIVIPGSVIPRWFDYFMGASIIRIVESNVDDNWIGFAFCVGFKVTDCSTVSGSSHDSFSSPLPHPLYLSFESEHAEERFDMPLRLDLDKVDGSEHLWLIYISRPHCHFVKTGARITFKARPGLKVWGWGLRCVFNQDIEAKKRGLNRIFDQDVESRDESLETDTKKRKRESSNQPDYDDYLPFKYVHEGIIFSPKSKSSDLKIQLPYNWMVTDEEDNDNMEAKAKENNLSNIGF